MGFCNFFFFVILERRDAEPGLGFEKRGLGPAPGCLGTGVAGEKKKIGEEEMNGHFGHFHEHTG